MAPATIFLDIDGTLLSSVGNLSNMLLSESNVSCGEFGTVPAPKLLPDVLKKLTEWEVEGYRVILTTGRSESMRRYTERELDRNGIFCDQLIMGLGGGPRYLINDKTRDGKDKAFAINLNKNVGLGSVEI